MSVIFGRKWFKYVLCAMIVGVMLTAYRIIEVEGETSNPHFVLMRLEDIGAGGQYGSTEQLGKLRAVLEYLRDNKVTYHLAIIPRWIDLPPDGSRYDMPLDKADDPYAEAYRNLLKQAVLDGAVLGMHGYTHQVGEVRRDDGHHESGIGNEFNVPGSDETLTAGFAEPRLKAGLAILERAGLKPQFWEAPHYRSTPEQDEVFRSYFGLNYQADVQADRNSPVGQYVNKRNSKYGEPTMGAAYVPTPFDYIPFNKDEKVIVDRVGKSENIASFFYHPFLEFKTLIPVTDPEGKPVLRDGLPEYRYPPQDKSTLQKLVTALKAKGYAFYSIQDYIPFTPAQSIKLNAAGPSDKLLVGDVTGDRQADLVRWSLNSGTLSVTKGAFEGMRNAPGAVPEAWGRVPYAVGAAAALEGAGGPSQAPGALWVSQPSGRVDRYASDGRQFQLQRSWKTEGHACSSLYVLPQSNGETVLAALSDDRKSLYGYYVSKDEIKPLKPYKFKSELKNGLQLRTQDGGGKSLFYARSGAVSGLELDFDKAALAWKMKRSDLDIPSEDGELRFGDFNGDGKEDVSRWNPNTMHVTVYLRQEADQYRLLSGFGPWGNPGSKLVTADLDGNGKTDLALVNRQEGYLDTALSFERQ